MYTKSMTADLSEYRQLYIKTSRDLINTMKEHIDALYKDVADTHAVTEFHRAAHSLKSQSLVMGYEQLGMVNRQLEAFFLLLKNKELNLNHEYITMVKTIIGHIEHALNDIDKSEHEPDLSEDINKLNQHTNITN